MNIASRIAIFVLFVASSVLCREPIDLEFNYTDYGYQTWDKYKEKYGEIRFERAPGMIRLKIYGEPAVAKFSFDDKSFMIRDINIEKKINNDGDSILVISGEESSYVIVIGPTYINLAKLMRFKYSFAVDYPKTKAKETGGGLSSGSGFAVNKHYLVTNNHVVQDSKYFAVSNDPVSRRIETFYSARVIYQDPGIDLAILYVDSILKPCELDRNIYTHGDGIYAYGYPQVMLQGFDLKMTSGIISSRRGYMDDLKMYQIDAAVQPGNSGGPIVKNNKVIGVVRSYLSNSQNVNYAIKSIFIGALLDAYPIRNEGPFYRPTECTYLIIGSNKE